MSTASQPNTHRVLIVDDSLLIRGIIKRILDADPDITVVGTAVNGRQAVDILRRDSSIETVILDIEMPVMDGLTALPQLLAIKKDLVVIVASTLTLRNADISLKCLSLGAQDYIPKPEASSETNRIEEFRDELLRKVKTLSPKKGSSPAIDQFFTPDQDYTLRPLPALAPHALVIGCSTGGPQALAEVFKSLKGYTFSMPIFIAQHMPPSFTKMLAEHISSLSGLTTKEGEDGEIVANNTIYIAPGNFHMTVEVRDGVRVIALNQLPHENFCRPSVNPLLRSVAKSYHGRVLGVMLTGMGSDGLDGAKELVAQGGGIIAQDKATSTVWGMPKAVIMSSLCSEILPLQKMAQKITDVTHCQMNRLEKQA